jgi:hypothetical protein
MKDVTLLLNSYREVARFVWNNFLRPSADFQSLASFEVICNELFSEVVLRPLGQSSDRHQMLNNQKDSLVVGPASEAVPIMINRPSQDGNKYWDEAVTQIDRDSVKLLFINYFDWDQMGFVDFQYYRVNIVRFDKHPELVGREALIDVQHARVFVDA